MPFTKDKAYWRKYNQKRRAYLTEKERQRRQTKKRVQPEHVQPTLSTTINHVQLKGVYNQPNLNRVQPEHVQPNLSTTKEKVIDLEAYNQEIYRRAKRAGIENPEAFFTFPDGRKIVRPKCGCNPTKDFYDWCLDSCKYFTSWRNKQKPWSEY